MDEKFRQAEDDYFVLRGRLETGRITREEFLAALSKLAVQDDKGKTFVMDPETGEWKESTLPLPKIERANAGIAPVEQKNKPATLPEQKRKGINKIAVAALITLILVCAILVGIFGVASLNKSNAKIVSTSVPQAIAAKDFATMNQLLAVKIAAMNQAQLKFIRDVRATSRDTRGPGLAFPLFQKGSSLTDEDLKDLAGKAMDVAIQSNQLGEMAVKQDKGSAKAAQSADPFFAIARNAFSLALDSQNVRQALQSGLIPGGQAIDTIASYGAQLWNSAVTDGNTKGNPFTAQTKNAEPVQSLSPSAAAQVQSQVNANNSAIWIAMNSGSSTITTYLAAAKSSVSDPFDPQLLDALTTASGQSDGNKAQQVAAANLQKLGATTTSFDPSKPTQLQVPTNSVAVSGGDQLKAGNIPSFKSGKATAVSKNQPADDNSFMQTFGLNGDQTPSDQGKTTVQDAPALVSLTLTNIVVSQVNKRPKDAFSTFEADVQYGFDVQWQSNVVAPRFDLDCASENHFDISAAAGSQHVNAKAFLILYPGAETAWCYASHNGDTWGSASMRFLVGDATGATQRAIQVETDSVSLDLTLTAEAVGTARTQLTQAAATAQSIATSNAVGTEVAGTRAAEFKLTAAAFATRQAQPPPATTIPSATPTFAPKVVDTLAHPGNVDAVSTHVVLQRGRLYRFTFSGRVNVINPPRSLSAGQLPDKVNGIAVPFNGVLVIQGTGGVATITCGHEIPDPNNPGAYGIVVEDLGPS